MELVSLHRLGGLVEKLFRFRYFSRAQMGIVGGKIQSSHGSIYWTKKGLLNQNPCQNEEWLESMMEEQTLERFQLQVINTSK